MSEERELLPCPWCMVVPNVGHHPKHGYAVRCFTQPCAVNPSTVFNPSRDVVVQGWNSRCSILDQDELQRVADEWADEYARMRCDQYPYHNASKDGLETGTAFEILESAYTEAFKAGYRKALEDNEVTNEFRNTRSVEED